MEPVRKNQQLANVFACSRPILMSNVKSVPIQFYRSRQCFLPFHPPSHVFQQAIHQQLSLPPSFQPVPVVVHRYHHSQPAIQYRSLRQITMFNNVCCSCIRLVCCCIAVVCSWQNGRELACWMLWCATLHPFAASMDSHILLASTDGSKFGQ